MKKILSLIMAILMIATIVACGKNVDTTTVPASTTESTGNTTESSSSTTGNQTTSSDSTTSSTGTTSTVVTPSFDFDPENIVLSFGALSDIHLNGSEVSEKKFKNALAQLQKQAQKDDKDGIDAISIAGDIADTGKKVEISYLKKYFEESGLDCELLLTLGNHETYGERLKLQNFIDILGDDYFKADIDKTDISHGSRHCVVNGYHFIYLEPFSYSGLVIYDEKTIDWLDKTLKDLTDENPNAYIFIFTHPMIYQTCYGSELGPTWYTKDLTETLQKYPQVMTFSGHLHFPINDERSIMQTKFTSLGCGSVRYLAIERGFTNANGTVPFDAHDVSSGLLVQVDKNGNVRITRMNFSENSTFKTPWELPAPNKEGTNLTVYTTERGNDENNKAPVLSGDVTVELSASVNLTSATLKFTAGTDDDFVHHYIVKLINQANESTVQKLVMLTDFYRYSDLDKMSKTLSYSLGTVANNTNYRVEITAVDSWNKESNTLTYEFKTGDAPDVPSELPAPYTELDFSGGTLKDSNDKLNITIKGAKVGKTTLTFGGKTKEVDALNISAKGQYAVLKFKEYSASTITEFYNSEKGFSVEGLYINRKPSGSQGIICGTQEGGFGLAAASGAPYLYTYVGNTNTNVQTTYVASNTELTHIVGTIYYSAAENKTYSTLYVNGKNMGSLSASGKMKISASTNAANAFCLGADIDKGGTGADFQSTDFSITAVKIYSEALNYKQVETAYNNALSLFN